MTRHGVKGLLDRIAHGVTDRLLRHVLWQASERRDLAGRPTDRYPLVALLGREHYSERRKLYPALRRRDLRKVLQGELAGEPPTISLIGPIRDDDRREVRLYRLDRDVLESLPRSLFVVPESALLATQLTGGQWVDVERQGYRYYLFHGGPSQPAGGVLEARQLVAMAAGMDPEQPPEDWRGSGALLSRFRRALVALPPPDWWACRNPLPRAFGFSGLALKPVAVTAGLMLVGYLAFASVYLQALLGQRDRAVLALGPEVQQGLIADNEAGELASRQDALIELWDGRVDTQQIWLGIASALANGAAINRVEMQGERISLRGDSPDAAEVLLALAQLDEFEDAAFDAPVRTGRNGRQSFALSFVLSDARTESEAVDD